MQALLIVDLQNDFLPGGALAAKDGDAVIPRINQLAALDFDLIVASKDWHPPRHGSFASAHGKEPGEHIELKGLDQILWPDHCVQGTEGAEFPEELDDSKIDKVIQKGTDKQIDSYSAFFDNGHLKSTGMSDYLKGRGVTDIYFTGLTTDYCVKFSVLDALKLGFKAHLVADACKPVNREEGDEARAIREMQEAGAEVVTTEEVLNRFS